MIPVNPIRWTLSILNSATNEGESLPEVFGSGYFDDAADVPGRPLLFYALQGLTPPSLYNFCAILIDACVSK